MNLAVLAEHHPAGNRALYADGTWHTWGDVRSRAAVVAASLSELGVDPGARVAIVWPTSVDFVAVLPRNPSGKVLKRELREPYWLHRERRIH